MKQFLEKLKKKQDLSFEESKSAFNILMNGEASEDQIFDFLTLLSLKGEVSDEIAGGVFVLRDKPEGKLPVVTAYSIVSLPSVAVTWKEAEPPSVTLPKLPDAVDHIGTPLYCIKFACEAVPPSEFVTATVYWPAVFAGDVIVICEGELKAVVAEVPPTVHVIPEANPVPFIIILSPPAGSAAVAVPG